MSTRLTTWTRERITKDVLEHRFSEQALRLVQDRAAFAMDVYNDIYSEADRKKMAALPNGWLPEDNDIRVQLGGSSRYMSLTFNGSTYGPVASVLKDPIERVTLRMRSSDLRGCAKVYDAGHPLAERYDELDTRQRDLNTAIDTAKRQVEAALASATTIKRLIDLWPEIEPFASKYEDKKAPLPALPTTDLNALLDLPVSEAA